MAVRPSSDHLDELRVLLSPGAVLTGRAETAGYLTPWRGRAGDAAAVARPGDTDQVRAVVSWARRHLVRLIPQGANTGLVGASTPPPDGDAVVVSLERLHRPPVIDPIDRTAVVDAGVRLSELNDAAGAHGLSLPIDLGADPTIGGMVATNTGGARMLRHGDMRAAVLGLRAVLADTDASVLDELTTLRKHNVGPSLGRLLIGSGGALGIVTQVALSLTPVAADRSCAWIVPSSDAAAMECLARLESRDHDQLSAFEVLSAEALDAALSLRSVRPGPWGDRVTPRRSALVEFEGRAGTEERLLAALGDLDASGALVDAVLMPSERAWAIRHAVTEGLAQRGTVVGFDVSVPRPRLPELISAVRSAVRAELPRAQVADFGHWGDGGVHCNLCFPHAHGVPSPPTEAELDAARDLVLGLVVEGFGGSFSAEHGVGPSNAEWWRRTTPTTTRSLLRALSEQVDPLGILGHPGLPFRSVTSADQPFGSTGSSTDATSRSPSSDDVKGSENR